jgi:hypothetical protein
MQGSQSTSVELDLADGPALDDAELGVHIIYVPESCGGGLTGAAALSQVASYLGKPDPTDIVVYDGKPHHCAGQPGHKKLPREHPKVHDEFRETVLVISRTKLHKVVWWSETPFTEFTIAPSGRHPGHADNPFYPEADSTPPPSPFRSPLEVRVESCNGRDLYVVRSTVPDPLADRHMYKISFTMDGDRIDPDAYCAP